MGVIDQGNGGKMNTEEKRKKKKKKREKGKDRSLNLYLNHSCCVRGPKILLFIVTLQSFSPFFPAAHYYY